MQPGKFREDIIISLCEPKFDENNPTYYEALSYVSRSDTNSELIYINDERSSPATQNLFVALKHLCAEKEPRTIWVDTLSIGQSNTKENSKQVAMISDIDGLAYRVIA